MRAWPCAFVLALASSLPAQHVLFDLSASGEGLTPGRDLPIDQSSPAWGNVGPSEQLFGNTVVTEDEAPFEGRALCMTPASDPQMSQFLCQLFHGPNFVFRSYRIECRFAYLNPSALGSGDGLSFLTDTAMATGLHFGSAGEAGLGYTFWDEDEERVRYDSTPMPSFDPTQPVTVIYEMDCVTGSIAVEVNGVREEFAVDISHFGTGLRNGRIFTMPIEVRTSFRGPPSCALLLEGLRIIGTGAQEPLITDAPMAGEGLISLPLQVPATGPWQAEYSWDGENWLGTGVVREHAPGPFYAIFPARIEREGFVRVVPR